MTLSTGDSMEYGRSPDSIVEAGAGGEFHRALNLYDLDSAAYAVEEEFGYDEDAPADELVRLCKELRAHIARLSITEQAKLTLKRECARCSGAGFSHGEEPCVECGGTGYVHADDADG